MDTLTLVMAFTIGDGYLQRKSETSNATMRIEHAEKQIDYARFKEDQLAKRGFSIRSQHYTSTTKKNYGRNYYRIDVRTHPILTEAYKRIYINGVKTLKNITFDPMTLAILFMDDGSAKLVKYSLRNGIRHYVETPYIGQFKIATNGFTLEDVEYLQNQLKQYDIESTIQQVASYNYKPVLHISTQESKRNFKDLIYPYMVPSMMYKVNHPITMRDAGKLNIQSELTQ